MNARRRLVALSLAIAALGGLVEISEAQSSAAPASLDHPYSDPTWSPLREPARVSCVNTNCEGPYHGYDAIDLVGDFGDPIYAAGAGVFHVGGVDPGCVIGQPTRGTWVWVDHGPAGSTRYHHLDSITATDGEYVTPGTQIGTMGNSGDKYPCEVAYLHMELRDSEETGTRLPIPNFRACSGGETLYLPEDWGYPTWDDVVPQQHFTPTTDNSCLPTTWTRTPERPPPVELGPDVGAMTVDLPTPPDGIDDVHVRLQLYHPSAGEFGVIHEQSASLSDTSVHFDDLLENRLYRAMVSYHNSVGWSAWSTPVRAETGFLPDIPEYRDSFSTAETISYKWYRGDNDDADYTVAIRRGDGENWEPWKYDAVPSTELSHRFRNLFPGATYQVTVRAENEFGHSRFASSRTISTVCHSVCDPPPLYLTLQPAVRLSLLE